MKHLTSISTFPLPLILVVLVANLQKVLSQTCPFDIENGRVIAFEGDDTHDEAVPLFSEETDLVVLLNATIETNETPGSLLTAIKEGNTVKIFAKQPQFGVESDYYGFVRKISDGISNGLQLVVQGDDGSPEMRLCNLRLEIHDTNNLAPHFNTSKPEGVALEFTVTTAWDKKGVPLNWQPDDWIKITDWDGTEVEPTFTYDPPGIIEVKLTKLPEEIPNANVWGVELFVVGNMVNDSYDFTITPSDGINPGPPLKVVLIVEEVSLFEPVFTSEVYSMQLSEMPEVNNTLEVTPTCIDPDDQMNGRTSEFKYKLSSDKGVTDYLDFKDETNTLVFKKEVPKNLMGETVKANILATKAGSDPKTGVTSQLELTFPLPSKIKFPTHIHIEPLPEWPRKNYTVTIPQATGDLVIIYQLGTSNPPPEGLIMLAKDEEKDVIQFITDVDQDMIGDLQENRVMIFDVVVTYPDLPDHHDLEDVITIVLTFPRDDATTENPTTPQDCSTTGNPSTELTTECSCPTEVTDITCPTELPTTPFEPTTPPDCMTTPECPEPTTCEPCGTTGNPTTEYSGTTEECPVCGTTEASDVTCGTSSVDPTGVTSGEPCTCPTQEPCEGSSSEVPCSTTPEPCDCSTTREPCETTCPTQEPCETTCPTQEPCETTCPTQEPCETCPTQEPCEGSSSEVPCSTPEPCDCDSQPTTCPTLEPCDCEDCDCSTTGLVVAVITTSVLCACSIAAGGYCLWLLRKATLDPTKLARGSFLNPDVSSSPSPPPDVEVHARDDYTTPHRFSFGDGVNEYSSGSRFGVPSSSGGGGVEPGFSNPNFTNDLGVSSVVDPVSVNAPPSDQPTKQRRKSSIKPPKDIEPDYDESPKKSNMKTPKEIEPDYEEIVSTQEPVSSESAKQSRVLFAPEDEVISIDEGSNDVVGDGGVDSDVEDERL